MTLSTIIDTAILYEHWNRLSPIYFLIQVYLFAA